MKTLFISLNKDFFLSTAGNFVVIAYDLLNDISYEIGAELTFMVKDDSLPDKARLVTDFKASRPEDYEAMASMLTTLFAKALLAPEIEDEITVSLPESYIDWLTYHSDRTYAEIGRKLREKRGQITLSPKDIYDDYIVVRLLPKIKETVLADDNIQKFTIENIEDSADTSLVNIIAHMRYNLTFEAWSSSWVTCEIAYAYNSGIGVGKDLEISFSYYEKAANKNNLTAANWLGWCYQTGLGTQADPNKAFYWYKKGKELGNKTSYANLGFCYDQAIGTERNYPLAVENYIVGADAGIVWAQCNLANIYFNGWLGEPNYTEAFKYYKMCSTAQGQTHAQYQLGYMLYQGLGTTKNERESYDYFLKAANAGYSAAYYYCGKLIEDGIVFSSEDQKTREQKASEYYLKGDKAKDINAALGRARIFAKKGDPISAATFYTKAVSANHTAGMHEYVEYLLTISFGLFPSYCEYIDHVIDKLTKLNYEHVQDLKDAYKNRIIKEEQYKQEKERLKKEKEEAERKRKEELEERMRTLTEVCEDEERYYSEKDEMGVYYNPKFHRLISAYPFWDGYLYYKTKWPDKKEYVVAEGTEIICKRAFQHGRNLTKITLPRTLRKIGIEAFNRCINLADIILPDNIEEIGAYAFYGCESLTEITLPRSLSIINKSKDKSYIFDKCDKLERIYIPTGMMDHFKKLLPEYEHLFVEK